MEPFTFQIVKTNDPNFKIEWFQEQFLGHLGAILSIDFQMKSFYHLLSKSTYLS